MPLISAEEDQMTLQGNRVLADATQVDEVPDDRPKPTIGETFSAGFKRENTLASWWNSEEGQPGWFSGINMDYDPTDRIPQRLLPLAEEYMYASSDEEVDAISRQLEKEMTQDDIIARSGFMGFVASMAGAIVDPVNLIPVGGTVAKGVKSGKTAMRMAASTAKTGLLTSAATEIGLQSTQRTRTVAESALNIGAETVLAGMIGGGVGAYQTLSAGGHFGKTYKEMAEGLGREAEWAEFDPPPPVRVGDSTVGAARVDDIPDMDDLTPAETFSVMKKDAGEWLAKLPVFGDDLSAFDPFNTPDMRILYNSQDELTKKSLLELVGTPLRLKGHDKGTFTSPQNVATNITRKKQEMLLKPLTTLHETAKAYKKDVAAGKAQPMKAHEFRNQVYMAAWRGQGDDIAPTGNKHIDAAAQDFKRSFIGTREDLKAMDKDFIPDGYVPQMQNPRAWKKDPATVRKIFKEKFKRDVDRAGASIFGLEEKVAKGAERLSARRREVRTVEDITSKVALKRLYTEIDRTPDAFEGVLMNDVDIQVEGKTAAERKDAFTKAQTSKALRKKLSEEVDDIVRSTLVEQSEGDIAAIAKSLAKDGTDIVDADLADALAVGLGSDTPFGQSISRELSRIKEEVSKEVADKLKKKKFTDAEARSLSEEDVINRIVSQAKKDARTTAKREAKTASANIREEVSALRKSLDDAKKKLKKAEFKSQLDPAEIDDAVMRLWQRVVGLPDLRDMTDVDLDLRAKGKATGSANNLKRRVLDWSEDQDLFQKLVDGGFVESDPERVLNTYAGTVLPDIEMVKMFGDVDGSKLKERILERTGYSNNPPN